MVNALDAYRAENGKYPNALAELQPRFIARSAGTHDAHAPKAGEPVKSGSGYLVYRASNEEYELICQTKCRTWVYTNGVLKHVGYRPY
jgi:hypothetical protein